MIICQNKLRKSNMLWKKTSSKTSNGISPSTSDQKFRRAAAPCRGIAPAPARPRWPAAAPWSSSQHLYRSRRPRCPVPRWPRGGCTGARPRCRPRTLSRWRGCGWRRPRWRGRRARNTSARAAAPRCAETASRPPVSLTTSSGGATNTSDVLFPCTVDNKLTTNVSSMFL